MARKTSKEEPAQPTIAKCKFSGDSSDEFCSTCNGITMTEKDKEISCDQCGGYEPGNGEAAPSTEATEPTPADNKPVEEPAKEETPAEKEELPSKRTTTVNKPAPASKPATPPPAKPPEPPVEKAEPGSSDDYESKAFVKEIKAESGISFETKDAEGRSAWYKFSYSETRLIPDDADIEQEKQILWDDVNATVDDQVAMTLEALEK